MKPSQTLGGRLPLADPATLTSGQRDLFEALKATWEPFCWKDYAHGNKKRKMTISTEEFLRRFLLHTLPRGFVRIRFFGFLAGPRRAVKLQLARQLLGTQPPNAVPNSIPVGTTFRCPICATPMIVLERLSAEGVCRAAALHREALYDSS
jgi:hypothetical protein